MRRQIGIAGAAAVLLAVLFVLFALQPKSRDISRVRERTEQARKQAEDLRLRLAQLNAAKRDAPATTAKLAQLNVLLPPTPDLPVFIRQLQTAANTSGVDLTSIAPGPPSLVANTGGLATISVTLNVIGGYFRLESFLARLETLQRAVEIQSLAISPQVDQATGLVTLASTVTLRMYVAPVGARVASTGAARPSPGPGASPSPAASPSPGRTP